MRPRKSKKANVDRLRFIFFQLGLILSISCVILAFRYKKENMVKKQIQDDSIEDVDIIYVPVTDQQKKAPKKIIDPIIDRKPKPIIESILPKNKNDNTSNNNPNVLDTSVIIIDTPVPEKPDSIFSSFAFVHKHPSFPGGENAMQKFIKNHTNYPDPEKELGIEGTVIVNFTVMKDGSIKNIKVVKKETKNLDSAAVEVIRKMPLWEPGVFVDKKVNVQVNLPIKFSVIK